MRPFWDTDVKVVSRRVKQGSIVRVYRGLYAVKEYWERLDQHERLRHARRSCTVWNAHTGSCIRFMSQWIGVVVLKARRTCGITFSMIPMP